MRDMKISPKVFLTVAATAVAIAGSIGPSFARGGGPANIMDSPGYQRRLQESRQQPSQPVVQPPSTHRHRQHQH
jgi:hypothetical protein